MNRLLTGIAAVSPSTGEQVSTLPYIAAGITVVLLAAVVVLSIFGKKNK